ncbi:MAG: oligosaccharide flippase family protein [Acidimicrobiia bacterium]
MSPEYEDRNDVSRAFRFSALNQVVTRIATFISGIIVMRILSPNDVGTVAGATAFVVLCTSFNDICMGPAVIQYKGRIAQAARNATTIALSGSVIIFCFFYFLAPYISTWLDNSKLTNVLRLLLLLVVIDGIGTVPLALLTRSLRQKAILFIETISLIIQISVTVILAILDFGPYSIVWGMIASNAFSALAMFAIAHEASLPGYHFETSKKLLSFGITLAISNLFRTATQYYDNIIVGITQGTKTLGYYQLGYNGGNLPETTISATVSRVSFAWFSKIKENESYRKKAFHDLTLGLLATTLPFVTLLSVLANDVVVTLYGEKWIPAANIVRILAVLGGIRVFINFFAEIFSANNKQVLELKLFSLWFISLVPSLLIGSLIGSITGVAFAHVLVAAFIILPFVLRKLHINDFSIFKTLKDSITFWFGALLSGISAYAVSRLIESPFVTVLVAGAVGMSVYVLCCYKNLIAIKKSFSQPDHGFNESVVIKEGSANV